MCFNRGMRAGSLPTIIPAAATAAAGPHGRDDGDSWGNGHADFQTIEWVNELNW